MGGSSTVRQASIAEFQVLEHMGAPRRDFVVQRRMLKGYMKVWHLIIYI
jgi:hypothetical protein